MYEFIKIPVMTRQRRRELFSQEINNDLQRRTKTVKIEADRHGRYDVRCYDHRNHYIGGTSSVADLDKAKTLASYYVDVND